MDEGLFRYGGSRYYVSFDRIKLYAYDPGYRLKESDGVISKTYVITRKNGLRKRIPTNRSAVICIVRSAYTGQPYSAIAILNPGEKRQSDVEEAQKLALKRALFNMAASIRVNKPMGKYASGHVIKLYAAGLYRAYREAMLQHKDPDAWKVVKERNAIIEQMQIAREKGNTASLRKLRKALHEFESKHPADGISIEENEEVSEQVKC